MNCSSIAQSTQDGGKLDLLITNLSIGQEGYRQLPLFTDTLRLAVASRTSLARARRVSLEALDGHPLIVRTHCEHLQHASRILDHDKVKPTVVHRTRYDDRALALVAGGLGACFIPDSFSVPAVKMLDVSRVDLRRAWASSGRATRWSRLWRPFSSASPLPERAAPAEPEPA